MVHPKPVEAWRFVMCGTLDNASTALQGGSTWDVKVSWLSAATDVRCITSVATDPVHDYYHHHPSFGLVKLLNRSLFGGRIGYIQKRFSAFSSYDVATYHCRFFVIVFEYR
jgi:hypothetical protein